MQAYTPDSAIAVHDIDVNCPEAEFPRLRRALDANGIACELRDWHVLQVRPDDLKVEFGAIEVWLQGIAGPYAALRIGTVPCGW